MNIEQLNQHPLNQAAAKRLRQSDVPPTEDALHLLDLAITAANSAADEGSDEPTEEGLYLTGFLYDDQEAIWRKLVDELDYEPEDLLNEPLAAIAQAVLDALTPVTRWPSSRPATFAASFLIRPDVQLEGIGKTVQPAIQVFQVNFRELRRAFGRQHFVNGLPHGALLERGGITTAEKSTASLSLEPFGRCFTAGTYSSPARFNGTFSGRNWPMA
jgi:hypothetical protein